MIIKAVQFLEHPYKNISHIRVLVTNFFPTLPIKLGLQVSRWETTNSKPLEPIKLSSQSETGSSQQTRFDFVY
jgi:hypothetical protein